MNQAEQEHHEQQVWCSDREHPLEAVEVLEAFVDDAHRDHRVDEVSVGADSCQGCTEQGDAVTHCEGGNKAQHIPKTVQKEQHSKQEQQVVVAGDHVLGTQPDVVQHSTLGYGRAGGLRDAMGQRLGAGQEQHSSAQHGGAEQGQAMCGQALSVGEVGHARRFSRA